MYVDRCSGMTVLRLDQSRYWNRWWGRWCSVTRKYFFNRQMNNRDLWYYMTVSKILKRRCPCLLSRRPVFFWRWTQYLRFPITWFNVKSWSMQLTRREGIRCALPLQIFARSSCFKQDYFFHKNASASLLSRAYLRKFIEHRSPKGSEQWSIPVRAPSYNHLIALITFGLRALFWHTDPLLFKAHDTLKNARGSLARIAEGKIEASNEDMVMLQKAIQ